MNRITYLYSARLDFNIPRLWIQMIRASVAMYNKICACILHIYIIDTYTHIHRKIPLLVQEILRTLFTEAWEGT